MSRVRAALIHTACAVVGLVGGYYAVLIVADWLMP
ncbi:hypothetical protein SEA_TANDEM_112 [Microbacterium phage Tandem]|nr:hypothetical protein SEA_TANDEM_1 [Microbacterium phage Tandem]AWY06448.1 hypothetical protein SEA_TANDEM_112 [Microbacterium phage Tandem]